MRSKEFLSDDKINGALAKYNWLISTDEGRLMALELLTKAAAGYMNSRTEEGFLIMLGLMNKGRQPNKRGRQFICSMVYNHSNNKPSCFELMRSFRQ